MTISVPDTFTIDSSGKYIMSIRLWSGGLSFSAYNPDEAGSFFYREVEFDRATTYINSIKETFFENDFFVRTYKRVYVLLVSSQYTVVPNELMQDKQKSRLFSLNFSSPEKKILSNDVEGKKAQLLFGINEEVYEFCSRSLTNPAFIHHVTPQLIMLKKQSSTEKVNHLFVTVHRSMMDLICFNEGKLLLVNSFKFENPDDLLYYILYVWRQLEMDQLNDKISLAGESALCYKLTQLLQKYIQHIQRMEIPSEAYLMGGEVLDAPMDLILHTVCE